MNSTTFIMIAVGAGVLLWAIACRGWVARNVIHLIPTMNIVADLIVTPGSQVRVVRPVLLFLLVVVWLPRVSWNRVNLAVFAFLGYMLLLLSRTSDPWWSFETLLKLALPMMLCVAAMELFRDLDVLFRWTVGMLGALTFVVVYLALAQLLGWGSAAYGVEDGVLLGEAGVMITYVIAYGSVGLPLASELIGRRSKALSRFYLVIASCGLLLMLAVFRRGAVLGFLVGSLAYLVLTRRRIRYARVFVVAGVLVLATLPLYLDTLIQQLAIRGDIVGWVSATDYGRMSEFGRAWNEFLYGSWTHRLFGTDLFNSRAYFAEARPFHVDYMLLLLTAGIVGLAGYLFVHLSVLGELYRLRRVVAAHPLGREMAATVVAIMACSLTMSLSSQIYVITSLSIAFTYMGGILGVLRHAGPPSRFPPAPRQDAAGRRRRLRRAMPNATVLEERTP